MPKKEERPRVVHYTVTLTLPDRATTQDARNYVSDALSCHNGSLQPDDPMSELATFTVSNVRHFLKAKKDG